MYEHAADWISRTIKGACDVVKVYADRGGWRIDVVLAGRVQRTAWAMNEQQAQFIINEFAAYYGNGDALLPVEKPW